MQSTSLSTFAHSNFEVHRKTDRIRIEEVAMLGSNFNLVTFTGRIINRNSFVCVHLPLIFEVIFKGRQWGLDRVFKYEEFVLVRGEAEDWNKFRVLENPVCPNWRPLNDFSESISVLAQWISVLVMNNPIVWNYILSPRTWTIISSPMTGKNHSSPLPSTSIIFQVRSRGAIQRVWLNDMLMNY